MRPRDNGDFMARYEPREVNNHFTEANAWQYSFAPVHDLKRWTELLQGQGRSLEGQLDALFAAPSATVGRDQADITGLIGQYAHGNEPSHHIAWLYSATPRADKGHKRIREILATMYSDRPDGYQGNEDCGQMSAWYVMSSWGIYPLVPGEARYAVGPMLWDRVALRAHGVHTDFVRAGNGPYFSSLGLPTGQVSRGFLDHSELLQSTRISMYHADSPSALMPYENAADGLTSVVLPAPRIQVPRRFEGKTTATIDGATQSVTTSQKLEAGDGQTQHRSIAETTKKPNAWTATVVQGVPNPQYRPGDASLVDGVFGDVDWRKGEWTGVQGEDVVINLEHPKAISARRIEVEVSLLKDIKSWIALPKSVELSLVFSNGTVETRQLYFEEALSEQPSAVVRKTASCTAPKRAKLQSVRVKLVNPGVLPLWHPGAGGETFVFVDELTVNTLR
jgi:hypothetical protein